MDSLKPSNKGPLVKGMPATPGEGPLLSRRRELLPENTLDAPAVFNVMLARLQGQPGAGSEPVSTLQKTE